MLVHFDKNLAKKLEWFGGSRMGKKAHRAGLVGQVVAGVGFALDPRPGASADHLGNANEAMGTFGKSNMRQVNTAVEYPSMVAAGSHQAVLRKASIPRLATTHRRGLCCLDIWCGFTLSRITINRLSAQRMIDRCTNKLDLPKAAIVCMHFAALRNFVCVTINHSLS